jgi:hypothetical protein
MDKSIKAILIIISGVLLLNLTISFINNIGTRGIRSDLKRAKSSADSALNELKFSKGKLDLISSDMAVFKAYINNVQKTVELADAEKQLTDDIDAKKSLELKGRIKELRREIANDTLPSIDEKQID